MEEDDGAFLDGLAEDSWRYLHSTWATSNSLPYSWRSDGSLWGNYSNPAEIGLYALCWIAAYDLQRPWSPSWDETESNGRFALANKSDTVLEKNSGDRWLDAR